MGKIKHNDQDLTHKLWSNSKLWVVPSARLSGVPPRLLASPLRCLPSPRGPVAHHEAFLPSRPFGKVAGLGFPSSTHTWLVDKYTTGCVHSSLPLPSAPSPGSTVTRSHRHGGAAGVKKAKARPRSRRSAKGEREKRRGQFYPAAPQPERALPAQEGPVSFREGPALVARISR